MWYLLDKVEENDKRREWEMDINKEEWLYVREKHKATGEQDTQNI